VSKLLIEAPIDVRWGDMDAFGHVNNSVYATYLEEARLRWFDTIDGGWMDDAIAPVIAASSINFRLPIEWPAALTVELFVVKVGGSSLTLGFRMLSREASPKFYADGSTVLVWTDRGAGKSVPLPERIRRAVM
jgi:acyl-CoA thioester hydrolase